MRRGRGAGHPLAVGPCWLPRVPHRYRTLWPVPSGVLPCHTWVDPETEVAREVREVFSDLEGRVLDVLVRAHTGAFSLFQRRIGPFRRAKGARRDPLLWF